MREVARPASLLISTRACDVPENEIRWLWRHWIPLGALTILEGDPGLGKSTILADMAAKVTLGHDFPFAERRLSGTYDDEGNEFLESPVRGSVVILSAEDDAQTTIVPRLRGAGAELDHVFIVEAAQVLEEEWPRGVILPLDIPALEGLCQGPLISPVKLIIIDPIMAYLDSGTDTFKDHEVRRALLPLQKLATKLGCAVLICRHLNKASRGKSGITSGGGSIAFTGAARSVIGAARIEESEWVQLSSVKSNLGPKPKGLRFKIEQGVDRDDAKRAGFWLDEQEYYPSVLWEREPEGGERIVTEVQSEIPPVPL